MIRTDDGFLIALYQEHGPRSYEESVESSDEKSAYSCLKEGLL